MQLSSLLNVDIERRNTHKKKLLNDEGELFVKRKPWHSQKGFKGNKHTQYTKDTAKVDDAADWKSMGEKMEESFFL